MLLISPCESPDNCYPITICYYCYVHHHVALSIIATTTTIGTPPLYVIFATIPQCSPNLLPSILILPPPCKKNENRFSQIITNPWCVKQLVGVIYFHGIFESCDEGSISLMIKWGINRCPYHNTLMLFLTLLVSISSSAKSPILIVLISVDISSGITWV